MVYVYFEYDQKRPINTKRHTARHNTRVSSYQYTGDNMEHEHAYAIAELQPGNGIMIPNCPPYIITHTIAMLWATLQISYDIDDYDVHGTDNGNTFISLTCDANKTMGR